MAWQVSKRVWENVPASITKNDRLMLLALADCADKYGVCWPGYDRLAEMVGVEPRSAMRLVQYLKSQNQIFVLEQSGWAGGRGYTNLYFVTTGLTQEEVNDVLKNHPAFAKKGDKIAQKGDKKDTLYHSKKGDNFCEKGDNFTQKGDNFCEKGDTCVTRTMEPSIEPSINHHGGAKPAKKSNQRPGTIPALKVFVEVIGKSNTLNPAQIKAIDQEVGRDPPALEKWREAVAAWNLNGNKLTDAAGMLDWFRTGKRSNYAKNNNGANNGHNNQKRSASSELDDPVSRLFAGKAA